MGLVDQARSLGGAGPYFLQASIAAQHSGSRSWEGTDWQAIVNLYDLLYPLTGSPVVALNRAVAVAQADGPEAGLAATEGLDAELDGFHVYHASRGEMLRRAGREVEARTEFERALELSANPAEQKLLTNRLASLGTGS